MLQGFEPQVALALLAGRIAGLKQSVLSDFLQSTRLIEELAEPNHSSPEIRALKDEFRNVASLEAAHREILRLEKIGIGIAAIGTPDYPQALLHLHEPPPLLFYRGKNLSALNSITGVAIVGARKADQLACDVAHDFARVVAQSGGCVVSGLAYGVDASAHRGALASGKMGATVAVLGNGLEFGIYPSAHATLAQDILNSGGLLLSQFPTMTKPFPSNFLDRNRVIAALAKAVLIVQAAERSGALATARHGMELGRDVLVVPGAIGDARYIGSNRLIKQGAYLVSEIEDVFALVPGLIQIDPGRETNHSIALTTFQIQLLQEISKVQTLHYDELLRSSEDATNLAEAIDELEVLKLINRLPGNFIAIRANIATSDKGKLEWLFTSHNADNAT